MKKTYFLLIALCFFATTKAQIVTIPDANFKAKLLTASASNITAKNLAGNYFKVDANSDGEIQVSEALQVSYLDVYNSIVSSLQGVSSFTNLQSLQCSYNKLATLDVSMLSNLQSLDCGNNQLTALDVSGSTNLSALVCAYNLLPNLNVLGLIKLNTLYCRDNKLTSLDLTGLNALVSLSYRNNLLRNVNFAGLSNLKELYCSGNLITNIDVTILPKLTTLYCDNNSLSSLNLTGLNSLISLSYSNNLLPNVDFTGHTNLEQLYCGGNKITSLDFTALPNLTILHCFNNDIFAIDLTGVSNLTDLNCFGNHLSTLNVSGLTNLQFLNCGSNKLLSLKISGLTNLQQIACDNNQLTSLNASGLTNLKTCSCTSNQLTTLNISGLTNLYFLSCTSNQLSSLFIKNGVNKIINFSNNPNLQYICADEEQITDIQTTLTQYGYTNCALNSYCSFTPGGIFYTLDGTAKYDSNSNGCDASDGFCPNLKFSITDGVTNGSLISNSTGNYTIPVQAGTHTITPVLENPTYFNISPTIVNVTFPVQASPFVQDFCITSNGVHPDLEITLLPLQPARPGFDAGYKIVYKNKGNQTQSGAVNLTFDDAVLDLVVANPATSTQNTNNLSWDFTNLLPFETREITFTLNVNSPMETPAVNGGDVLAFNAAINSVATDETPIDNAFAFNQTVVNSFDPNDKTCLEGTTISPDLIGQYVHYMIRFENNGTANAQNIVVKDMIDLSKFDISTLVPTNASHSFVTNISAGNKVEFIFENINLPFDDANNDGYIAFKIKTKPTLVVNDTFTNDASIYFDYNFPIVTKLASSTFKTLGTPDFEFAKFFTLYPNPAREFLNITAKETIEVKSISVYNTLGQLVLVIPNAEKVLKIDVSGLTAGNYFIKINSDKGTSNTKFIKE